MKKILLAFFGCAGSLLLVSGVLKVLNPIGLPRDSLSATVGVLVTLVFWTGIVFLVLTAVTAVFCVYFTRRKRDRYSGHPFVVEHLP